MKLKKGDTVAVIKGKDKGKTGKIASVFLRENRVLIEGVNLKKRHRRARRAGQKGEIVTIPHPLAVANVRMICKQCGKKTRIGYRLTNGQKLRICKKCGTELS